MNKTLSPPACGRGVSGDDDNDDDDDDDDDDYEDDDDYCLLVIEQWPVAGLPKQPHTLDPAASLHLNTFLRC